MLDLLPVEVMTALGLNGGDGWLAQAITPISPSTFDATLVRTSTAGSNLSLATNSGQFTLQLYRGDAVIAASVFDWMRNGSDLIAAQPLAVTAWVRQYQNADGFSVSTSLTFGATTATTATVQTAQIYNGTTVTSVSQSFPAPRAAGTVRTVEK